MRSTFSHLDAAIAELAGAKSTAEFFGWSQEFIDRIDLVKRATANLKERMLHAIKSDAEKHGDGSTASELLGIELSLRD